MHALITLNYFSAHLQSLCLPFLSLKLTHNVAHSTQCLFNRTNVWVPSRAAAAEPNISALHVGEQLQGLSVVPSAEETPDDSGDHSKEAVKESSGLRDISKGKELTYFDKKVMHLNFTLGVLF